jgi:hypothetical protein
MEVDAAPDVPQPQTLEEADAARFDDDVPQAATAPLPTPTPAPSSHAFEFTPSQDAPLHEQPHTLEEADAARFDDDVPQVATAPLPAPDAEHAPAESSALSPAPGPIAEQGSAPMVLEGFPQHFAPPEIMDLDEEPPVPEAPSYGQLTEGSPAQEQDFGSPAWLLREAETGTPTVQPAADKLLDDDALLALLSGITGQDDAHQGELAHLSEWLVDQAEGVPVPSAVQTSTAHTTDGSGVEHIVATASASIEIPAVVVETEEVCSSSRARSL